MSSKNHRANRENFFRLAVVAAFWTVVIAAFFVVSENSEARSAAPDFDIHQKQIPNVDVNAAASAVRQATGAQVQALNELRSAFGSQVTVRWNDFAGSPDVIMNFHTPPSSDTPEAVARAFVQSHAALFGIDASTLVLDSQTEALGGYLLRFQQKVGNLEVAGGGIGFVMNREKQIRMVMGSSFRDVSVADAPALSAAAAATRAATEIAQYAAQIPGGYEHLMTPGLDAVAAEIAPILREPRLNVYPTADGYRLAWSVITFSRNPFGLFVTQVDAATGEILSRQNHHRTQQSDLPYTADIFPSSPILANPDTSQYEMEGGIPKGLTRVQLRAYNPGMNATAVEGTLTGPRALIRNVLATKQPFVQAAQGTFHFRQNNPPLEAQPNEADDLAEPAQHFDGVNMYFFINYLLEYIDDIHRRGDSVHNRIGTGDFPDNYVNSDRPLVGLVHIPNIGAGSSTYRPYILAGDAMRVVLGYDNAASIPLSETIDTPAGRQKIVVNPTIYGHGYLLNDLAKDGPVAYHEGMHSISTPIAGLEGEPEGSALNEGQADLWAYAITGEDEIGGYTIRGAKYRERFRNAGVDPNTLAYIRTARSSLKYSQLGTRGNPPAFEEHNDGEIYAAAMFELLELMKTSEPQEQFVRPAFTDGAVTRPITRGQNSWERIFLGSLYLLGMTSPDTFVKARDALIMADRILYSTDPSDLDAPGQHEALIWQVFAAREIGLNAKPPQGGVVTISTAVPQFALDQTKPAAPQGVVLEAASPSSVRVSWQPVEGAYAYEVFKRRIGRANERQYKGIPGRPYFDGDQSTTGWSHVAFVTGGSTTSYEDKGFAFQFFAPAGIKSFDVNGFNEMFGTEYAVRAVKVNPNRQSGFSDLSAGASFASSVQDVTNAIQSQISNVSFTNGVFQFDQTLKNNGVSQVDPTAYGTINFKILRISDPTVTVENADNGGDGRSSPAIFGYNQTLALGQTSAAKRLRFNDPNAVLFTFDALVTARVRGESIPANGSQPYDGDGGGTRNHTITTQTETFDGLILAGAAGSNLISGVDYVDVPFVAQPGSYGVTGVLSSTIPCDLDFLLLDSNNNVLSSSGNITSDEEVSGVIVPGRTYKYRVVGWANGPTPFQIVSTQFFSDTITTEGSGSSFGQATQGIITTRLVRFTVNPLTNAVSVQLL